MRDLEFVPVTANSCKSDQLQAAAEQVGSWLQEAPEAADKPVDEILNPEFAGMFAFYSTTNGEYTEPLAYIAQRKVTLGIHEVTSFIVNPEKRGKGIGSFLLKSYTHDLQNDLFPGIGLVAVANSLSLNIFKGIGFTEFDGRAMPLDPTNLRERSIQPGKTLVLRSPEDI